MKKKTAAATYLVILACIMLTKVLGMARNMFLSAYYSTGDEAAVFQAISKLPLTLYDVTLGTAIVSAFIPMFNERYAKDGKTGANRFGSNFLTLACLVSLVICAVGMCFPRLYVQVVASGFSPARMALAVPMVRIILPIILFATVAYIFIGILQSYGEFTAPALVSLFTNLAVILYFLTLNGRFGIQGVATALTVGWSFQLLFLLPFIVKKGFRFRPARPLFDADMRHVLVLTLPLFVSSLAQPINTLISTNLSSRFDGEALSTLSYAYDAYFIVAAVFASALTNLYFPELSRRFAAGDHAGAAGIGAQMLKTVSAIILPVTAFLLACGTPVVRALYQRGAFTADNTRAVALCLAIYCLSMLALSFQEILNKFYYSMQKPHLPMMAAIGGIVLNLALSFLFVNIGHYPLLAVATVISGWCMAVVLLAFARKYAAGLVSRALFVSLGKTLVSAAAAGGAAYGVRLLIERFGTDLGVTLITLLASLIACGAVYFAGLWLMRSDELGEILKMRRKGARDETKD